ncbi:glycosyltransferase family 2 protein [Limibaculum sp. M0105]|uniref:Glycosyltransferase family 2 protein n=1 Tax=Thermohalobaculum xanthum TaxID=2753746 RepID=A0A8J7SFG2_9RHOB|nr:glycosyltransferase family 2 protein [Thermohalobaculum xanthum]MBK0400378.1 glycosyltransferase family 2 protein [Thermohalobaculum xanthum]
MKLIIQIPCLNEEATLPQTIADLPSTVPGFDAVEVLVIDDGSTDATVRVARELGVDHVISLGTNMGLARAFMAGVDESLRRGADVVVNTDADNQYRGADISRLVAPILAGEAQIVVGARPITEINSFSPLKKLLQRVGSWVVRKASGADVADAPSGFRAYHRDAAIRLYVLNTYTYTLETIIQAGRKRIPIASVPVGVNPQTRESRLIGSMAGYVLRSALTIIRIFVLYEPLRFFSALAVVFALPAIVGIGRFLWFYASGDGGGHVQSLVLSGSLMAMAFVLMMGGVLADLIAANRAMVEDIRARQIRQELDRVAPSS